MQQPSYQCIDPCVLFRAVECDLSSFRELSQTYLDIAPPMFARLEKAFQTGAGLADACHSLKGATVLVGAAQLTGLLVELEHAVRDNPQHDGRQHLSELRRLFLLSVEEVHSSMSSFNGQPVPADLVAATMSSPDSR